MEITIKIDTIILIIDVFETIIVFLVGVGLGYFEGIKRKEQKDGNDQKDIQR